MEIICYLVSLLTVLSLFLIVRNVAQYPKLWNWKLFSECCIEHSKKQFHFQPNEIRNFSRKLFVLFGFFLCFSIQIGKWPVCIEFIDEQSVRRYCVLFFCDSKVFPQFYVKCVFSSVSTRSFTFIQHHTIHKPERNKCSECSFCTPYHGIREHINWGR